MKTLLAVLLFCSALAPPAEGQTAGRFANGWGTLFKRDSTFRVDLYASTFKHIGDSLGYGSGGAMNHADSIKYFGTPNVSPRTYWNVGDTAAIGLIDASGTGSKGWNSWQAIMTTEHVSLIDQITITHSYDSSTGGGATVVAWRFRDTCATQYADSIPACARIYLYYSPASDVTAWNNTGKQIIGAFYTTPSDATAYLIGTKTQVPLINSGGGSKTVLASHRGVRSGHVVRASVRLTRKVIGVIY